MLVTELRFFGLSQVCWNPTVYLTLEMAPYTLTTNQLAVVERPLNSRIFLHGPAGTGKSTAGVERLRFLLSNAVPGDSILVLTSQRVLQDPYLGVINSPDAPPGGYATPMTMSGLARRVCNLFWPLASRAAGFGHVENPPVFLTLETAQYYMAHVIRPLLGNGYFEFGDPRPQPPLFTDPR